MRVQLLQSLLTLHNPTDSSPPGSSVHGILQARTLEWVDISFSRGSFWPRDRSLISCMAGRFFTTQPPGKSILVTNEPPCSFVLLWDGQPRKPFPNQPPSEVASAMGVLRSGCSTPSQRPGTATHLWPAQPQHLECVRFHGGKKDHPDSAESAPAYRLSWGAGGLEIWTFLWKLKHYNKYNQSYSSCYKIILHQDQPFASIL